jgi:hypothetical protein
MAVRTLPSSERPEKPSDLVVAEERVAVPRARVEAVDLDLDEAVDVRAAHLLVDDQGTSVAPTGAPFAWGHRRSVTSPLSAASTANITEVGFISPAMTVRGNSAASSGTSPGTNAGSPVVASAVVPELVSPVEVGPVVVSSPSLSLSLSLSPLDRSRRPCRRNRRRARAAAPRRPARSGDG